MSERDHAMRDGARLQPNSGRGSHAKGDAILDTETGLYLIDYKEYSKSFSISVNNWSKVCSDALKVNREAEPVLKLDLDGKIEVCVMDWSWFLALARKEV